MDIIEERHDYASGLKAAGQKLVTDIMLVQPNQKVILTADEKSDSEVLNAIYDALEETKAVPIAIRYPSHSMSEGDLPIPIRDAVLSSDLWIELAERYALYSPTRFRATEKGVRYGCFTGMDADMFVRAIGRVEYSKLLAIGETYENIIRNSHEVRIKSQSGTDFTATGPVNYITRAGKPDPRKGSITNFAGTISWISEESNLDGTISIDGEVYPPEELGLLHEPIILRVKKGFVTQIEGGRGASILRKWFESFHDENMYRLAHLTVGYHPQVGKLRGKILEDERLLGCFEIGIGAQGEPFGAKWKAKSHTDGVIVSPEIKIDGTVIARGGSLVDPRLAKYLQ